MLGDGVRVFLHRVLSVETHTKKGDVSEPKTLVMAELYRPAARTHTHNPYHAAPALA